MNLRNASDYNQAGQLSFGNGSTGSGLASVLGYPQIAVARLVQTLEPDYRRLDRELLAGWRTVPPWVFGN